MVEQMKIIKTPLLLTLIALVFVTGCASSKTWYQAGKSHREMIKDLGECKVLSYTKAQHKNEEKPLLDACMNSKGYIFTSKSEIPTNWFDPQLQ
jgi:hypothetical protein